MRTGTAHLPLHTGQAPAWLFRRMTELAGVVAEMMVQDAGADALLQRLSDPRWFQAFGCVLGFDWHSSGVTTTTCGALKEGIRGRERQLGLYIAGGKGAASRKTPEQIMEAAGKVGLDGARLVRASKLTAKVDNTAVQDGYQLYHHSFIFTTSGKWAVVQQGMNDTNHFARRYHWFSPDVRGFVNDPHSGVAAETTHQLVLNMVAGESELSRESITDLVLQGPHRALDEIRKVESLDLPGRHWIAAEDLKVRGIEKTLVTAYEKQPENFAQLLETPGLGPKSLRALVMVSELVYGAKPSWRDPALYSFAHGGKDGIPYPVDRPVYDQTVDILKRSIEASRMGNQDKLNAVRRLAQFWPEV